MNTAIAIDSGSGFAGRSLGLRAPLTAAFVAVGLILIFAAVHIVRRHHRDDRHRQHRY